MGFLMFWGLRFTILRLKGVTIGSDESRAVSLAPSYIFFLYILFFS